MTPLDEIQKILRLSDACAGAEQRDMHNLLKRISYHIGCGDPDCDLTKDLLMNGIQKSKIYQSKKYREGFNSAKFQALDIVRTSEDPQHSIEALEAMKPIEIKDEEIKSPNPSEE